jgi:hypothetical protein
LYYKNDVRHPSNPLAYSEAKIHAQLLWFTPQPQQFVAIRSTASINTLNAFLPVAAEAYSEFLSLPRITIESFVGFFSVPVGLAGPLNI